MNTARARWSRRYQKALRRYLEQGPSASPQPALKLGRDALSLGLETLDVARMHEQALTALAPPGSSSATRRTSARRAKTFFTEAIVPIEASHRAARKAEVRIGQLTRTLRRRTKEACASAGQLERAVAQRRETEAALKKIAGQHAKRLAEAQRLQKYVRHQMRENLAAQEDERQKASRELRNEIAQALLAIDLSLLALRTSAKASIGKLNKEIANAQRLVGQSRQRAAFKRQ